LTMLARDGIKRRPQWEDVPCAAFGDVVRLRRLPVPEYLDVARQLAADYSVDEREARLQRYERMVSVVASCAVDEAGSPLFTGETFDVLRESPDAVGELLPVCLRINGFGGVTKPDPTLAG
jgi:hypothetical protein